MRKNSITILLLFLLTSVVAVAGVRQGLGLEISPFWLFLAMVMAAFGLALLTSHPAAFITPWLFAPQYKAMPVLSRFQGTQEFTALAVLTAMLGLAVFIRLLGLSSHHIEVAAPFRGQWKRVRAFLLFAAVVAFSYVYTVTPVYGGQKLLRFLTFGGFAFFVSFVLLRSEEDFRDFVVGTLVFALGVAAYSARTAMGGGMGPRDNPVHIGMAQLIGMAVLLLLYYEIPNRRIRFVALFVGIPLLVVGFVSAVTRGPLVGVLLVLLLSLVVPALRTVLVSRRALAFGLVVAIAAISLLASGWFRGRAEERLQQKISEVRALATGSRRAQGSAVQRLDLYKTALRAIRARPVLGWGLGGWLKYYNHTDYEDVGIPTEGPYKTGHVPTEHYPHNLFLEVGVEQGLVGLGVLLLFLGGIFRAIREHGEELTSRFPFLLPLLIYLLLIVQVSGEIIDNRFLWFWCGAVLAGCQLAEPGFSEEPSPADSRDTEASPALESL